MTWSFGQVAGGVSLLDTEEVTGSIPVSPTTERPGQRLREEIPARPFLMIGPVPEHSRSIASRRSVDGLRTAARVLVVGYFLGSLSASRMRMLLSVRHV
jgi:hypothetical protein